MEEVEEELRQPKEWSTLDLEDLSIDQHEKYIITGWLGFAWIGHPHAPLVSPQI